MYMYMTYLYVCDVYIYIYIYMAYVRVNDLGIVLQRLYTTERFRYPPSSENRMVFGVYDATSSSCSSRYNNIIMLVL